MEMRETGHSPSGLHGQGSSKELDELAEALRRQSAWSKLAAGFAGAASLLQVAAMALPCQ